MLRTLAEKSHLEKERCVGFSLRYRDSIILIDDGLTERMLDVMAMAKAIVESLVRHDTSTWSTQQVSKLR
jgi:hypothetical protein